MADSISLPVTPETPAGTPVPATGEVRQDSNGAVLIAPIAPASTEPTLIGGKFKDQAALLAAYQELEKKQGAPKAETPAVVTPEVAQKAVTDAGLDLNKVAAEIARDGKMSDETIKVLESKGIKREQAELHVEGLKALADKFKTELATVAGGADEYTRMIAWAKANVDKGDLAGFDAAILSGNTAVAKMAVRGLAAQYKEAIGTDPNLVTGDSVPTIPGVKPFESTAAMVRAMSDPRYAEDPAYRKSVEQRLAAGLN